MVSRVFVAALLSLLAVLHCAAHARPRRKARSQSRHAFPENGLYRVSRLCILVICYHRILGDSGSMT